MRERLGTQLGRKTSYIYTWTQNFLPPLVRSINHWPPRFDAGNSLDNAVASPMRHVLLFRPQKRPATAAANPASRPTLVVSRSTP